jgi:predicted nuclease with TOPRIM domain
MDEERESTVSTTVISEDSNAIVHDLVYQYSGFVGSGSSSRDFILQITDPENPLLLFDYTLTPFEFPGLRAEQQLLCEFSGFPDSLNALLDSCNSDDHFKAVIDHGLQNGPCLMLQEVTTFSLITHLKLPLVPAGDSRLKEHLSAEVQRFKAAFLEGQEEIETLRRELATGDARTAERCRRVQEKARAHHQSLEEKFAQLTEKHEVDLNQQREEATAALLEQSAAFDRKEQLMREKYDSQVSELRATMNELVSEKGSLVAQNGRLAERIASLEAQLSDARGRLKIIESENRALQNSQSGLLSETAGLKTQVASLSTKQDALQAALQEKSEQVASVGTTVDELRTLAQRKDREIAQLQQQFSEAAQRANDRDWIADKSKQVIAKHREDIRKLIQHHNERKSQWEAKVEEMKQTQIESIRKGEEIKALHVQVQRCEEKLSEMQENSETLKRTIEKMENEKKESQQMIAYLEKELNTKGKELLDEDALDSDVATAIPAASPARLSGVPGRSFASFSPRFPEHMTSLFDNPTFY